MDADGSILSNKLELLEEFKTQNAHLIDEQGKLNNPITAEALTSLHLDNMFIGNTCKVTVA